MYRLLSLLIAVAFCTAAFAQDLSTPRKPRPVTPVEKPKAVSDKTFTKYVFNLGSHTEFYNAIQTNASGARNKFEFKPTIGAGLFIPLESSFTFLPEFNWVLPNGDNDYKIIKNIWMLRADLGYDLLSWLRLRLGTSLMWMNQHGRGGSTQVQNGNSYSTFYYPDENRSSLNSTLDFGFEGLLSDEWAVRLQTYTFAIFNQEKRQLSYTFFVTYYWDRK